MSAPYTVRYGYCREQIAGPFNDLEAAIFTAWTLRKTHPQSGIRMTPDVFGSDIDLDNPYGLTREESERVWEGVEDGLDVNGEPHS